MPLRRLAGLLSSSIDPLRVPNAPTNVSATATTATTASVSFTAPTNTGGGAITGYAAGDPATGAYATGASSPIAVSGLTGSTTYTFQVWALNLYGPGPFALCAPITTPSSNPDRALFAGGFDSANSNIVEYVTVSTTGNSTDFGDLLAATSGASVGLCGSTIRGLMAGGGSLGNTIQYMTFATTGNATDFGDLTAAADNYRVGAASNNTRGLFGGGYAGGYSSVISYVTINTTGNTTSFGYLTIGRDSIAGGGSPTRSLFLGGNNGGTYTNIVDYVTIATTGNATDFGDLISSNSNLRSGTAGGSDTRLIYFGGVDTYGIRYGSQYFTIATTGNATTFGTLSPNVQDNASFSNNIRAGSAWGQTPMQSAIQYVTVATTGNATNFGYLSAAKISGSGMSSNHGGLQ